MEVCTARFVLQQRRHVIQYEEQQLQNTGSTTTTEGCSTEKEGLGRGEKVQHRVEKLCITSD